MELKKAGINSKLVHAGEKVECLGSAVQPIFQTSTFQFENAEHGARCFSGESDGYIYTRLSNPTIKDLEKAVAAVENGFDGIATSSGMGAINTVYLAYLGSGDHMISTDAVYGPSRGIMESLYPKLGIESSYIDTTDIQKVKDAIMPNTKLIYIETPANPTISITDIKAVAEIGKEAGIPVCVDNTFCSPYLQRPLDLGADIVLHSMTKFINGHADIVAGMIVTKTGEEYKKIRAIMTNLGCNMDPTQAFMTRRGLKTLGIRIERAQQNAIKIAEFLENHPAVAWVKYPGLKSHPQYELAKVQMDGPGAMMSFGLKGGFEAGKKMMDHVKLALLAVSLGGIETLIQHPASMTHSKLSKDSKEAAGITDELVRLSVGIEEVQDIIADLDQAMK
ncbi:MAG: aminotransferase class I/II-fold pyridoxal phosphate-dependent enzyme [Bacteroidales bacterium]|nr:aminotransferase class I/II-fold pyridoxal phosphate-dependent enzyme [Bacteroidales bacterium]MCF8345342.1 aminotransferase class I/II-fold pyridoxal phosphate-dependent enzyme [Bacteroidales bacterium]MCF8352608.1 aminotransferase class I/II-fold pyridoxal phosphate-dependent enzyme [Bacteroidales bacterium]MCF8375231.1 aminotransferase class I/II-fold pyridoxal phosphate-dependent enzyme [Bacteroidales bacterium]MCF8400255.1 aminotransferase class I/II-fold pyridoxal phosphate-dependent e